MWLKILTRWVIKIPPLLAYIATLPCETLMSAINDKLQGSVAAYLSYCGVVNNQITKGLFLSLSVNLFKLSEYLAKLQARTLLSRALNSFLVVWWLGAQSA